MADRIVPLLLSKPSWNTSAQDNSGNTALHILMMMILINPDMGGSLWNIICLLTTSENVNIQDANLATTYTWMLRGKMVNKGKFEGIFSRIEELFLKNGADLNIAKTG